MREVGGVKGFCDDVREGSVICDLVIDDGWNLEIGLDCLGKEKRMLAT